MIAFPVNQSLLIRRLPPLQKFSGSQNIVRQHKCFHKETKNRKKYRDLDNLNDLNHQTVILNRYEDMCVPLKAKVS